MKSRYTWPVSSVDMMTSMYEMPYNAVGNASVTSLKLLHNEYVLLVLIDSPACSKKEATETVIILSGSESGETDSDSSGDEEIANKSGVRPTENSSLVNEPEQGTTTPSHPLTVESDSPNESADQSSVSTVSASKRPCLEAFSVGVQPYRPYENLPDVHGGYQRVLKSLKNSRECLSAQSNGSGLVNLSDTGPGTPSVQRDRNNSSYYSR
ncbi:unnamed protein product [Trichobilharzia regenti]|nr:unnamed protein product [Trichobilharzia regenti]